MREPFVIWLQRTDARLKAAGFSDCSWSSSRRKARWAEAKNMPEHIAQVLLHIENIKLPSHVAWGVLKLLQRQIIALPLPSDRLHICGAHKHIIIHTFIEVLYKNQVLYPVIWHAELTVFIKFFMGRSLRSVYTYLASLSASRPCRQGCCYLWRVWTVQQLAADPWLLWWQ